MKKKKMAVRATTIVLVVVAFLAFISSVVVTIVFHPSSSGDITSVSDAGNGNASTGNSQNKTEEGAVAGYDISELRDRTARIEELYTEFSDHVDSVYGLDATSIDLTNDPVGQAILEQFIGAVDELDQTINNSPYDDLKQSWQEFRLAFDKRRDYVINGVNDADDTEWALELMSVYSVISSKIN